MPRRIDDHEVFAAMRRPRCARCDVPMDQVAGGGIECRNPACNALTVVYDWQVLDDPLAPARGMIIGCAITLAVAGLVWFVWRVWPFR